MRTDTTIEPAETDRADQATAERPTHEAVHHLLYDLIHGPDDTVWSR